MRVEQARWTPGEGWRAVSGRLDGAAQVVLVFGSRDALEATRWYEDLRRRHPSANVIGCSTAGEILGDEVTDGSITATAIRFERTRVRLSRVNVREFMDTHTAGIYLGKTIDTEGLSHVMVFADGQHVNGSELVRGLTRQLPANVAITGGLAGDGARFERTYVCANGPPIQGNVAALAFYGDGLRIGYGSLGGWDPAGDERRITRARGNVLEQLDGRPALRVYAEHLGPDAAGLPASGLLHPLAIRTPEGRDFVRTLLNVNRDAETMTFAGDVPVGSTARFMTANFSRLVEGASGAAARSQMKLTAGNAELAILISCVGRKLVLKDRVADEVAAVRRVLGEQAAVAGFYSYGEICPAAPDAGCELHNQTMTITTLSERA